MKNHRMKLFAASLLALLTFGFVSPSRAETCAVRVVFTKGGFIVGVGGGNGVLTCRGRHYRFVASGMSVGFTIGASTAQLTGRALNLRNVPADIQGTYAGGVQLQNEKGVILQLAGGKVGVELSAAVGGVTIALQ
jgi:hypothetical protein